MKEKKERKKWGLMMFIVFIMVGTTFSFVYYGFQPANDVVKYNGVKFVKYSDRWEAKINERTAAFSFLPAEVKDIPAFEDFASKLQNKIEIDVTYDLNDTYRKSIALAQHQMSLTLEHYEIFVRKGFTTNNTFNQPIITCNDSTVNVPVVYFRAGNSTAINLQNNCVIAEAISDADVIKVKDRLLYGILGVIK